MLFVGAVLIVVILGSLITAITLQVFKKDKYAMISLKIFASSAIVFFLMLFSGSFNVFK